MFLSITAAAEGLIVLAPILNAILVSIKAPSGASWLQAAPGAMSYQVPLWGPGRVAPTCSRDPIIQVDITLPFPTARVQLLLWMSIWFEDASSSLDYDHLCWLECLYRGQDHHLCWASIMFKWFGENSCWRKDNGLQIGSSKGLTSVIGLASTRRMTRESGDLFTSSHYRVHLIFFLKSAPLST